MHKIKIIKKNVKNITIRVNPTCEVILTAPLKTRNKQIREILETEDEDIIDKEIEELEAIEQVIKSKTVIKSEDILKIYNELAKIINKPGGLKKLVVDEAKERTVNDFILKITKITQKYEDSLRQFEGGGR